MKKYRKMMNCLLAGVFALLLAFPGQAQAAAKLELVNRRAEPVMAVYRTWDAAKNTNFTQGWIALKPDTSVVITLEHYGDWEQVIWLFAISPTKIWQGDPNENLSDPDISLPVNSKSDFQYWGKEGSDSEQKDWERVYCFAIPEKSRASFSYTFE